MTNVLTEELLATLDANSEQVCKADDLDREEWLQFRKPYIGGSEAAASIGLSPYESPYSLWVNKTTDGVSDEDNQYMKWGRRLEEAIGLGIAEDTDIPVVRYPYMLASRKWPWAAVNLDFLAGESQHAPPCVVEVKNIGRFTMSDWDDGAVPAVYGLQGQHACAVTGLPGVHFFPLIAGNDGRAVYVERNDSLIENLMEGERKFWELVQNNTPPAVDGSAATSKALKGLFMDPEANSETDLPPESFMLLERRAIAKARIKEHQEVIDEVENQMKAWLGNAEIGIVNGMAVVSWKKQFRSGYTVAPTSFRKFNPVKPKVGKGSSK